MELLGKTKNESGSQSKIIPGDDLESHCSIGINSDQKIILSHLNHSTVIIPGRQILI